MTVCAPVGATRKPVGTRTEMSEWLGYITCGTSAADPSHRPSVTVHAV